MWQRSFVVKLRVPERDTTLDNLWDRNLVSNTLFFSGQKLLNLWFHKPHFFTLVIVIFTLKLFYLQSDYRIGLVQISLVSLGYQEYQRTKRTT